MDRLIDLPDMWGSGYEDVRARTLIILLYSTGVRLAEVVGLDSVDVNFVSHQLKVTGKRDKQRIIPFGKELEEALRAFRGRIDQVPPMYSAIRVNGRRLYEIARRGGEVERKPRPVTIHSLELVGRNGEGDFLLDVRCSKGTYVRTLCHDIGRLLGCGACMSSLRRVEVGAFSVEEAHTMDELVAAAEEGRIGELLLGVETLFPGLRRLSVDAEAEKRIRCGNSAATREEDGRALVYGPEGKLLMLGEIRAGVLSSVKNFFEV